MEKRQESFVTPATGNRLKLEEGVHRTIIAFDEKMMMVKVEFEKGCIGALHHHYHTQITYITEGIFEVEIDGEKRVLAAGSSFYVAPDISHGVVCLQDGVLIDVFSPCREDFL
jgi:quercetin dioxygenase-like cupin family protein